MWGQLAGVAANRIAPLLHKWLVRQENSDSNREDFRTKTEAVDTAKERARKQEPSQVKVHKSDGNMEYESTYGDDPARSRS